MSEVAVELMSDNREGYARHDLREAYDDVFKDEVGRLSDLMDKGATPIEQMRRTGASRVFRFESEGEVYGIKIFEPVDPDTATIDPMAEELSGLISVKDLDSPRIANIVAYSASDRAFILQPVQGKPLSNVLPSQIDGISNQHIAELCELVDEIHRRGAILTPMNRFVFYDQLSGFGITQLQAADFDMRNIEDMAAYNFKIISHIFDPYDGYERTDTIDPEQIPLGQVHKVRQWHERYSNFLERTLTWPGVS